MFRKSIYKKIFILFLAFLMMGAIGVAAQEEYELLAPLGDSSVELGEEGFERYLDNLLRIGVGLTTVFAVLMIVIAGFRYIITASAPSKEDAKEGIRKAIYGLLMAAGAIALLSTINVDLASLNSIRPVQLDSEQLDLDIGTIGDPNVIPPSAGNPGSGPGWYYNAPNGGFKVDAFTQEECEDRRQTFLNALEETNPSAALEVGPCVLIDKDGNSVSQEKIDLYNQMILSEESIRNELFSNRVDINHQEPCRFWGDISCTMVGLLPRAAIDGLIDIQNSVGSWIVVTGGTEAWYHQTHGPNIPVVDLRTLTRDSDNLPTLARLSSLDSWIIETAGVSEDFGSPSLGDVFRPDHNYSVDIDLLGNIVRFTYEQNPDHWHIVFPEDYN